MIKNYSYKTQRGSVVELAIEVIHVIEETNLADHNFTNKVSKYEYKVLSITVAGKSYNGTFTNLACDIKVGMQGNQPILVAVPKEIVADFHQEERVEVELKVNKFMSAEKKYQEEKAITTRAMNM